MELRKYGALSLSISIVLVYSFVQMKHQEVSDPSLLLSLVVGSHRDAADVLSANSVFSALVLLPITQFSSRLTAASRISVANRT
jgi:hypothetical protein